MKIRNKTMWSALVLCMIFVLAGSADAASAWRIDQLDDMYPYNGHYAVPVLEYGEGTASLTDEGLLISESFSTWNGNLFLRMPLVFKGGARIIVTENNGYAYIDLLYRGEPMGPIRAGMKVLKATPYHSYQGIYVLDTNIEDIKDPLLILPLILFPGTTGYVMRVIKNPYVYNDGYIIPLEKVPSYNSTGYNMFGGYWRLPNYHGVALDYDVI